MIFTMETGKESEECGIWENTASATCEISVIFYISISGPKFFLNHEGTEVCFSEINPQTIITMVEPDDIPSTFFFLT